MYTQRSALGYEVLFMDQPKARLGGMLADIELIGIPHRVVIGERGLDDGTVEYRHRKDSEHQHVKHAEIVGFLHQNRDHALSFVGGHNDQPT